MIFAHMTNTKNCVRLLSLMIMTSPTISTVLVSVVKQSLYRDICPYLKPLYIQIDIVSPMLLIEYPIWPLILPQ